MRTLEGRTVFITGASRGIGRAIALRCARDGANVVIAAKTAEPHPRLAGTIHSVAEEVRAAGGRALAVRCDIRDEAAVVWAVEQALAAFGGIDVLVNNASAIGLTGTLATSMARYDLMQAVNARGTFLCSRTCLPHLKKAANAHVLTLSPPPDLDPRWFQDHLAYTLSKFGMSLCTLGMAAEFAADGVAFNSLWPRTTIATAAVEVFFPQALAGSRRPEIVAEAAHAVLVRDSRTCTGRFFIDEDVLREEGVTDFSGYALAPGAPPTPDLFTK
ncbi:MAG: NAD(P)-dependent oxidoreductase [Burkholderiales bacterium]|nr:NAD(P)-dependent oxidoreductase [Burkholderiales bacterium]